MRGVQRGVAERMSIESPTDRGCGVCCEGFLIWRSEGLFWWEATALCNVQ